MKRILKTLNLIKKSNLYPTPPIVSSPHEPETIVNGDKMLLFASNNYLGMLNNKRVIEAAVKGVKKWGIGNGSARLLTGNITIHKELEDKIAAFKKKESALTFVAGYMVNEGCIPTIANVIDTSISGILRYDKKPDTIIFTDELNHASIIAGISLSKCKKEIYKHNNMDDLEQKLKKYSKRRRKLIITDGVFSMDGDIAKLPKIVELSKKYNCLIYLDDAHATGILGKNGRGTEELFNIEEDVHFTMGTFTKAFGGVGGYITSKKEIIEYLISSKSFIFTAPIAPPVVCGLIESINIVKKEPERRKKLLENAEYLRNKLQEIGLNTLNSQTQIIPVLIGDERKALKVSNFMLKNKIFSPIARWPAVPKKSARIRFALMHSHTKNQMDKLIHTLKEAKKKYKI
ncbi:MAG: aminotransferase class I/II-fold pyridoxal phosphate-dependent enzyme [Candidatus Moranbacteria bacterium]|nr:aminotransferase class I/II-fold pyridoxal phosphate-dependent enzyme [Candidatus Moranbacteria bacterium]